MNELRNDPSMAFVRPFYVALNHRSSIVVNILNGLVWDIDKWDVVEIPIFRRVQGLGRVLGGGAEAFILDLVSHH